MQSSVSNSPPAPATPLPPQFGSTNSSKILPAPLVPPLPAPNSPRSHPVPTLLPSFFLPTSQPRLSSPQPKFPAFTNLPPFFAFYPSPPPTPPRPPLSPFPSNKSPEITVAVVLSLLSVILFLLSMLILAAFSVFYHHRRWNSPEKSQMKMGWACCGPGEGPLMMGRAPVQEEEEAEDGPGVEEQEEEEEEFYSPRGFLGDEESLTGTEWS